jgi:hypothetical protein
MSDVVILLIMAAWAVVFGGYIVLCDRVGR